MSSSEEKNLLYHQTKVHLVRQKHHLKVRKQEHKQVGCQ